MAAKSCEICGLTKDEDYLIFRNDKYFCSEEHFSIYYTVKGINIAAAGEGIASVPPTGYFKVVNMYVNPGTGKLTIEYDNTPT
jgi:hypothetical protein